MQPLLRDAACHVIIIAKSEQMTCMTIKKDPLTRYKQTQVYTHKEQLKQVRVTKILQTSVFFPFGF